jgi:hypothetical protein
LEAIPSFVQSPHTGDDPEHFILLHAAAMERLHRVTGSIIDNSKHPRVRQHLFVDHVLADYRGTQTMQAIGDRVVITAID